MQTTFQGVGKMQKNPLQKFEVEAGTEPHTRRQTCRVLCSWESTLVSAMVLLIACGQFYMFLLFTYFEVLFTREGVWVFFALGTLSCLLVVWFIVRTCIAIQKDRETKERKLPLFAAAAVAHYNSIFDVNGKYYLAKLYFAEAFEHAQQVYSMTTIYLCLMPVRVSVIMCAVLTIELLTNIWATFHISSQAIRGRLILLDIVTDLFCVTFPLSYTWFLLKIPVNITELHIISIYPTLSLLSKLNDIWEDYFNIDMERAKLVKQKERTTRRTSIFKLSHNFEKYNTQLKNFPNRLRYIFTVLNMGFLLFFLSVAVVQLASISKIDSGCKDKFPAWDSCLVKVPFCNDLLFSKSHCNCAVFEVNGHNWTRLPETVTTDMWALKRLVVRHGPLKQIPEDVDEKFERLSVLDMSYNHLSKISERFGDMSHLNQLKLANNMLTSLPHQIWNCVGLFLLDVDNNYIETLPDGISRAVQLRNLFARTTAWVPFRMK